MLFQRIKLQGHIWPLPTKPCLARQMKTGRNLQINSNASHPFVVF